MDTATKAQEQRSIDRARAQLIGPVHGALQTIRGMCTDGEAQEAIDRKVTEADELVFEAAAMLGHQRFAERRTALPVEVNEGKIKLSPPLLFSLEHPGGVLLEDLLEQLVREVRAKQVCESSRETAMVITKLEEALLWQQRRSVVRGTAEFVLTEPRRL